MTAAGAFDPQGVSWTRVSPALARLRRAVLLVDNAVLALIVVGLALWLGHALIWAALLVPLLSVGIGWVLIGRQVGAWGYAERDDDLLVRRGVMFQNLVVVPYGRMQFVDVQAGPLDRAFSIATVQLHTASAQTDSRIPGLSPDEAARLRDRLASRGQARLAGL